MGNPFVDREEFEKTRTANKIMQAVLETVKETNEIVKELRLKNQKAGK